MEIWAGIFRPFFFFVLNSRTLSSITYMNERPKPDPKKLLTQWNEWETGETPPGRVMSNLKTGGLPELLEKLVEEQK